MSKKRKDHAMCRHGVFPYPEKETDLARDRWCGAKLHEEFFKDRVCVGKDHPDCPDFDPEKKVCEWYYDESLPLRKWVCGCEGGAFLLPSDGKCLNPNCGLPIKIVKRKL